MRVAIWYSALASSFLPRASYMDSMCAWIFLGLLCCSARANSALSDAASPYECSRFMNATLRKSRTHAHPRLTPHYRLCDGVVLQRTTHSASPAHRDTRWPSGRAQQQHGHPRSPLRTVGTPCTGSTPASCAETRAPDSTCGHSARRLGNCDSTATETTTRLTHHPLEISSGLGHKVIRRKALLLAVCKHNHSSKSYWARNVQSPLRLPLTNFRIKALLGRRLGTTTHVLLLVLTCST